MKEKLTAAKIREITAALAKCAINFDGDNYWIVPKHYLTMFSKN